MASTITNQATLNYNSGTVSRQASSNTASVTMQGPLELSKYSHENAYHINDELTFNIFLKNTSNNTLYNLIITDNLGTFSLTDTTKATPLTFISPAKLYINNVYQSDVSTVVSDTNDSVEFKLNSLAPGVYAVIQYKAITNHFAGADVGTSRIINSVSVIADNVADHTTATNTIPVASYADVTIEKTMSPDPVVDGSTLTYAFHIKNYGNIPATDVVLADLFSSIPDITSVKIDGVETSNYSLIAGKFTYPVQPADPELPRIVFTIPAATFTTSPLTGVVTSTPGKTNVEIVGTI